MAFDRNVDLCARDEDGNIKCTGKVKYKGFEKGQIGASDVTVERP